MELFNVYPVFDIHPVKGSGSRLTDGEGNTYLDLYGGHAVISIGHGHPRYTDALTKQLNKLGYYSNSVRNGLQKDVADKLGKLSGCGSYQLFLCNSGAEANENALKLASFHTGKSGVIAFSGGFHGRTSAAVAATDNDRIKAPINRQHQVDILPLNQLSEVEKILRKEATCAVIIECVQGVGGLDQPDSEFIKALAWLCKEYGVLLIADEVQSGFGRTGKFFAYQHHEIEPDLITTAKGMGNGFPVGGVLIGEHITPEFGMLGTTFGGNHLACSAVLAVLDVMQEEGLMEHAVEMESFLRQEVSHLPVEVKGRGLMLGLAFDFDIAEIRKKLVYEHGILTGSSKNPRVLRILPPLNIAKEDISFFVEKLKTVIP